MARKRASENEILASAGAPAPAARRKTSTASRLKKVATAVAKIAAPALSPSAPATEPAIEEFSAVSVVPAQPSHDEVARLAYSYWESRGYQGGSSEEDWVRAELELRAR
jgi:hypothetical protein